MSPAKEQLRLFFSNPVFLACIFSWFCAQLIKTCIKLFSGKVHSVRELFELMFWRTGSMPSSHAALVSTLCTTVGFRSGINSDVFMLSFGLFLITIRDAVGVRRANGTVYIGAAETDAMHLVGKAIKNLSAECPDINYRIISGSAEGIGERLEKGLIDFKPIKEVQGHKPVEVAIGSLLGFFIGVAFCEL